MTQMRKKRREREKKININFLLSPEKNTNFYLSLSSTVNVAQIHGNCYQFIFIYHGCVYVFFHS
jgi:hypothetical protein